MLLDIVTMFSVSQVSRACILPSQFVANLKWYKVDSAEFYPDYSEHTLSNPPLASA